MPLANDFQMGRSLARELLAEQVGVEVDIPLAAINGHWDAPSDRLIWVFVLTALKNFYSLIFANSRRVARQQSRRTRGAQSF